MSWDSPINPQGWKALTLKGDCLASAQDKEITKRVFRISLSQGKSLLIRNIQKEVHSSGRLVENL